MNTHLTYLANTITTDDPNYQKVQKIYGHYCNLQRFSQRTQIYGDDKPKIQNVEIRLMDMPRLSRSPKSFYARVSGLQRQIRLEQPSLHRHERKTRETMEANLSKSKHNEKIHTGYSDGCYLGRLSSKTI